MTVADRNESMPKKSMICKVILTVLLLIQASLLAYLSWATSPNRTEVGHIGAAVYLWHSGKYDVFNVNPPLVRFIAGMPVSLFFAPKYDWKPYSSRPQDRREWVLGRAFLAANELDELHLYVFLMRLACIPLVLMGGYFGYRLAAELYGEWSGVMFAMLWAFSPLVLGWGATICPDVAAASMGIVGLYMFWHWLKNPGWKKAVIAGICLGLMPLTKTTWIIAFPIWSLLFIMWRYWKKKDETRLPVWQFATLLLIAVYVINSGYLYEGSLRPLKDYTFISGVLTGEEIAGDQSVKPGNRFASSWIGYAPVPLPNEFVQGIDTQKLDFERGMESYARGIWADRGWWWYYGYVLLIREPLGVWGLATLALFTSGVFRNFNASKRDELTMLIPLLLVFAFLCTQNGFSIHPRYVIIALPLLYISISRLAKSLPMRNWGSVVASTACLLWIVVSSLSFYPYSMSYFNELAGGPPNWPKRLLGSNISWGQEAFWLMAWAENNPEARPLYISYTSPIPLEKLGIKNDGRVPTEPTPGWMIIEVNELFGRCGKYEWLQKERDVKMIGYSLWIVKVEGSTNSLQNRL